MKKLSADITKAIDAVKDATRSLQEELMDAKGRAEDYFEERSENWKDSERGQKYEAWIEDLEYSVTALQEALDGISMTPEE